MSRTITGGDLGLGVTRSSNVPDTIPALLAALYNSARDYVRVYALPRDNGGELAKHNNAVSRYASRLADEFGFTPADLTAGGPIPDHADADAFVTAATDAHAARIAADADADGDGIDYNAEPFIDGDDDDADTPPAA